MLYNLKELDIFEIIINLTLISNMQYFFLIPLRKEIIISVFVI